MAFMYILKVLWAVSVLLLQQLTLQYNNTLSVVMVTCERGRLLGGSHLITVPAALVVVWT